MEFSLPNRMLAVELEKTSIAYVDLLQNRSGECPLTRGCTSYMTPTGISPETGWPRKSIYRYMTNGAPRFKPLQGAVISEANLPRAGGRTARPPADNRREQRRGPFKACLLRILKLGLGINGRTPPHPENGAGRARARSVGGAFRRCPRPGASGRRGGEGEHKGLAGRMREGFERQLDPRAGRRRAP